MESREKCKSDSEQRLKKYHIQAPRLKRDISTCCNYFLARDGDLYSPVIIVSLSVETRQSFESALFMSFRGVARQTFRQSQGWHFLLLTFYLLS